MHFFPTQICRGMIYVTNSIKPKVVYCSCINDTKAETKQTEKNKIQKPQSLLK